MATGKSCAKFGVGLTAADAQRRARHEQDGHRHIRSRSISLRRLSPDRDARLTGKEVLVALDLLTCPAPSHIRIHASLPHSFYTAGGRIRPQTSHTRDAPRTVPCCLQALGPVVAVRGVRGVERMVISVRSTCRIGQIWGISLERRATGSIPHFPLVF